METQPQTQHGEKIPPKGSCLAQNDEKWQSLKEDIHKMYITKSQTLPITMREIESLHGFKASERKWKIKLKEWGYLKKLSEDDMKTVLSKVDRRSKEGKQTVVTHAGSGITKERIKNFKKRKTVKDSKMVAPDAATPACVSYGTPNFECDDALLLGDPRERMSEELQDPSMSQEQTEVPEEDDSMKDPDTMTATADGILALDAQSLHIQDNPFGADEMLLTTTSLGSIQADDSNYMNALHIGEPKDCLEEASVVVHARNSHPSENAARAEYTFYDLPQHLQRLGLPGFQYLLNNDEIQRLANIRDSSEDRAKLAVIISVCIPVLDRYMNLEYPEPQKVCALQFELAQALRSQNRFEESVSMYRRCYLGYQQIFGTSDAATLKALRCLVDILIETGEYEDATLLCDKALVAARVQNRESIPGWQRSLAYIIQSATKMYNALETLLFLLSRALNDHYIAHSLSDQLKAVLEAVHSTPDRWNEPRFGSSNRVDNGLLIQLLGEMLEMVEEDPTLEDMKQFPHLMVKSIELVKSTWSLLDLSCSITGREAAETLFEYGITRSKKASSTTSCYEKADLFYWYAKQLIRQRQFDRSISYLLDSWDILVGADLSGEPWGEQVLKKIEKVLPNFLFQLSRSVESPLTDAVGVWNRIEAMSGLLGSIPPIHAAKIRDFLHGSYSHQHLERLGTHERAYSAADDSETVKTTSSLRTTSTMNFKFGATLSGSEYLGFSIADMMGPYRQSPENSK